EFERAERIRARARPRRVRDPRRLHPGAAGSTPAGALGILRGSLTFSRFFVAGDIPDDIAGASLKRIRANAFRELVPEADDASRHGWCSLQDPMDVDLDHEKVFWNEYLALGLRIDTWVVPKPLLAAHLRNAEASLLEKKGLE